MVGFGAFFNKWFDFCNFTTSRERTEFYREITKLKDWYC